MLHGKKSTAFKFSNDAMDIVEKRKFKIERKTSLEVVAKMALSKRFYATT